jgi:hypothetical protein
MGLLAVGPADPTRGGRPAAAAAGLIGTALSCSLAPAGAPADAADAGLDPGGVAAVTTTSPTLGAAGGEGAGAGAEAEAGAGRAPAPAPGRDLLRGEGAAAAEE